MNAIRIVEFASVFFFLYIVFVSYVWGFLFDTEAKSTINFSLRRNCKHSPAPWKYNECKMLFSLQWNQAKRNEAKLKSCMNGRDKNVILFTLLW